MSKLDEAIYTLSLDGSTDEEVGDANELGLHASIMRGGPSIADALGSGEYGSLSQAELDEVRDTAGVILTVDNYGFREVYHYDDKAKLEKDWAEYERELGGEMAENARRTNKRGHQLADGTWVRVYKSRETGAGDPWTAVLDSPQWNATARGSFRAMLALTASGASEFTEGQEGRHLGKELPWSEVPDVIRRNIERRTTQQMATNARGGEVDETAADELHLYIDNESDLSPMGPSGQGKSIRLNLEKKIANGTFNYELSIKGWEHLAETGAKRYAKEFASAGEWSKIFSPATRRRVAEFFAKDFADEHQMRQNARDNTIFTYGDGRPIRRPERSEFDSDVAYLHAFHAYKDEIARVGNEGFDAAFRKEMRKRPRR